MVKALKQRLKTEMLDAYSTGEDFANLFEESLKNEIKEGTVTQGEIIAIDGEMVVVDVGAKNEGYIPIKEFKNFGEEPKIGDVTEVYVERKESRNGNTIISREKAVKEKYWVVLEKALEEKSDIDGTIFGKVKGGFTVDISGIIAFLPGSQVDIRPVKDITPLMGIKQPFRVIKIDKKQGNVVVSRRAILEESRDEIRNEVLAQINVGQVLEGVVKNITDYGAFIDLGKVDGLLHVTDMSWGRISHPSEMLTLGQTVKVQVIKFDEGTKRISLGMKQLEHNPWESLDLRFPKGKKFGGKITNITDYGIFIELEPGIEGLVHVSEISWSKNNINPKKEFNVGQEVEYVVLDIDINKHRISLGMKQCSENPWAAFAEKHPVGTEVEGVVKNTVDFGLFLGFEGDIDGLIHVSDLDWSEDKAKETLKSLKKDDKLRAKVLALDVEKERIALGVKQLTENPNPGGTASASAGGALKKGDVVTCVVKEVQAEGIDVEIEGGITSFIKKTDLSADKAEQRAERFAVGERVDAKVISATKGKYNLSIKALEVEEQKKAIAEYGSTDSGASLGDILGVALKEADKEAK